MPITSLLALRFASSSSFVFSSSLSKVSKALYKSAVTEGNTPINLPPFFSMFELSWNFCESCFSEGVRKELTATATSKELWNFARLHKLAFSNLMFFLETFAFAIFSILIEKSMAVTFLNFLERTGRRLPGPVPRSATCFLLLSGILSSSSKSGLYTASLKGLWISSKYFPAMSSHAFASIFRQ